MEEDSNNEKDSCRKEPFERKEDSEDSAYFSEYLNLCDCIKLKRKSPRVYREIVGHLKGVPLYKLWQSSDRVSYRGYKSELGYKSAIIRVHPDQDTSLVREFGEFLVAFQREDFRNAVEDFVKDKYWNEQHEKIESIEFIPPVAKS